MPWSVVEKYALNGLILCLSQPQPRHVTPPPVPHTKEPNLENPTWEGSARGPQNTKRALRHTPTSSFPSSRCFPLLRGNSVFSIKSSNKEFKCPLQHRQCSARHPLLDTCKARRGKIREDEGPVGIRAAVISAAPLKNLTVLRRKNWHTGWPRGQPYPLSYVTGSI